MIDWWEKLYGGMNNICTYFIIFSFLSPISTLAFFSTFCSQEINVAVKTQRLPSSATCWQPPVLQTCSDCSNPGQDRDQQVICPGRRKVNVELLSTRNFWKHRSPKKRYVIRLHDETMRKRLNCQDLGKSPLPKLNVFGMSSGSLPCENQVEYLCRRLHQQQVHHLPPPMSQPMPGLKTGSCRDPYAQLLAGQSALSQLELQMAREMNLRNSPPVGASGAAAPVPSLWALKQNHGCWHSGMLGKRLEESGVSQVR